MLRKTLNQRNPCSKPDLYTRYQHLFRGGHEFRENISKFLHINPNEPPSLYADRKRESAYIGYAGPICTIFASQILASPMSIRAKSSATGETVQELDDFYSSFAEDIDLGGTDLIDFFRARLVDALVANTSWMLARLPSDEDQPPANRAEWDARGLGRAILSPIPCCQVLDWHRDDFGQLDWVITYHQTQDRVRPDQDRAICTDTWSIYDANEISTFSRSYDPSRERPRDEDEIPRVSVRPHGFTRLPIVDMSLPEGLWLLDVIAEAQIEHFRLNAALHLALKRCAYQIPIFCLKDPDSKPEIKTGSYIILSSEDDIKWLSPPMEAADVLQTEVGKQRDEIFRIAHATALGVDVNQAAAVGRSAESKAQDNTATDKSLLAYATVVKNAIERVYELVSDARGDAGVVFSVEGLDKFNLADVSRTLENARTAKQLGVPSVTFKRAMAMKTADALLPGLDQAKKDQITQEIEAENFEPVFPVLPATPGQTQDPDEDEDKQPPSSK